MKINIAWSGLGLSLLAICANLSCHTPLRNAPEPAQDQVLMAASNFLHPPFSSRDQNGEAIGIEVELVAAAARQMGIQVQWVERTFAELLPAVTSGQVALAGSTIGVTRARSEIVAFSDPYFVTTIVVLVREGPGEPRSLAELNDQRIGTERNTTAVPAAAAHLPKAQAVLERSAGNSWAEMLIAGEIDGIVLDRSHADKFMRDAGTRFHMIKEPLREEFFALAVHHNSKALLSQLNRAIAIYKQK